MEDYQKTTGKEYSGKSFSCHLCGDVFIPEDEKKIECPSCGSSSCKAFKQTTASLPKNNKTDK